MSFIFDEFDEEDFDYDLDEEDGDFDSLDEFDDTAPADDVPTKKKSSFLFWLISIVIAVLGGGFVYTQLTGAPAVNVPPANQSVVDSSPDIPEVVLAGAPALVPVSEDLGGIPMPAPEDIVTTKVAPVDDFDSFLTTENPSSDVTDIVDSPPAKELSDDETGFLDSLDTLDGDVDSVDELVIPEDGDQKKVVESLGSLDVVTPLSDKDVVLNTPELVVDTLTPEGSLSSEVMDDSIVIQKEEFNSMVDRLATLERMVQDKNDNSHSKVVEELQSEVSSLEATISVLEQRLDSLDNVTKVQKAVKRSGNSPVATKRKSTSKAVSLPTWTIRSAQPGKALLSSGPKAGGVSVKVGDVLSGLGRIDAIGLNNNGLWEVKGSISSVLEAQ